jgi:serine/threonine protein kinase
VVGTTMYMAPELALGPGAGRKYGLGVDYWALGCVTYEMLTGEAPFGDQGDESKIIILQKIEAVKVSLHCASIEYVSRSVRIGGA